MSRRRQVYEGKAKVLFEGPEPGTLVQYFKDDATAFNNRKQGTITGKGVLNNRISEYLMTRLGEIGIPTHFVRRLNMREQLIKEVEIIPIEVVARNVAAGSFAKRFGMDEGAALPRSVVEYYYKSDELNDPMITEEHVTAFGWATPPEIDEMISMTLRVNDFLGGLFFALTSGWSISRSSSGACGKATTCAWCWPTRSAPTIGACGTSRRASRSTRTASGATWGGSRKATRRWRGGSASCPKAARAT